MTCVSSEICHCKYTFISWRRVSSASLTQQTCYMKSLTGIRYNVVLRCGIEPHLTDSYIMSLSKGCLWLLGCGYMLCFMKRGTVYDALTHHPQRCFVASPSKSQWCVCVHPEAKEIRLLRSDAIFPNGKVHEANRGPIWGRQDPGGPLVGSMNYAIWVLALSF